MEETFNPAYSDQPLRAARPLLLAADRNFPGRQKNKFGKSRNEMAFV
jgi:hypothetical protein